MSHHIFDQAAQQAARDLTLRFSSSFGLASKLFSKGIRQDIYNIYALARVADEIVDSYRGGDAAQVLLSLRQETTAAIVRGYSSDLVVHAFQITANRYGIDDNLIRPFFDSMAMDLEPVTYDDRKYSKYIYGSAEVIGLMCLKVFVGGDDGRYEMLRPGAQALGSAFQKINFLRDIADDQRMLGRNYFPSLQAPLGQTDFLRLNDATKESIVQEIRAELVVAEAYIRQLPKNSRHAVATSARYYGELLEKLDRASADEVLERRISIGRGRKLWIFGSAVTASVFGRK